MANDKTGKLSLLSALALFITACNGGSSADNTNTIQPVTDDGLIKTNEAVELILHEPSQAIANIVWQQTAGPAVTFLASNSKVIAFTTKETGQYQFTASYDIAGQSRISKDFTLDVNSGLNTINARLGHAVIEGNKVSLRSEIPSSLSLANIRWSQTAGPVVTFTNQENETNNGQPAIFFNAPAVEQDTIATFEVSLTQSGSTYTDTVSILIEATPDISNNAYFDEPIATVYPANANSPYANNLAPCVYANTLTSSCTLAKLPLIAQDTTTPSTEDIMDRVLVSHPWMAERFSDFLNNFDDNNDFKNLLRATTAVVISYDVRPSFYWASTGAIYLDANNLWLSPDERDTLNEAPDYRAAFGNDLQFVMPWRYIKDNDYASNYIADDARVSRSQESNLYNLARLLYHELAHANDFFPSTEWHNASENMRVLDVALATDFESDQLATAFPLTSTEMRSLAQVRFQGNSATDTQKAYQPSDVALFFSGDNASDFYNYSSLREDFAMLFEELMMVKRYGVVRDVAITNQPTGDNISGRDYKVTWGQRGRVGEEKIKPRVLFSTQRVLPEFDASAAIATLPAPIAMTAGDDWIENLTISPTAQAKSRQFNVVNASKNAEVNNQRPVQWLRYHHKALPKRNN